MSRSTPAIIELQTADQFGFDLLVKRSPRRRTIELIIRDGRVQLMLPAFVSHYDGLAFVKQKQAWILRTLQKHQHRLAESPPKQYQQDELFGFLGNQYPLNIKTGSQTSVALHEGQLQVTLSRRLKDHSAATVKRVLHQWYRQQALQHLEHKSRQLAGHLNRPITAVKLRRTKSKWGHCTAKGEIQYNWQIIAAPEAVIDYLVAHEVAHLVHHNHGKRFWRLVEKLYPDYRQHQAWLRANGHRLVV